MSAGIFRPFLVLTLLTVTQLTPADFPALSLMIEKEGIQGRPVSGQVVQTPDGTIWVQGEVMVAPGLVRDFKIRAGQVGERPGLKEGR